MGSSQARGVDARIKDAAICAVSEEGLDALSVRAICARARVSEADFHERWPDAWAAFLQALDERGTLPELPDTGALLSDLVAYARGYAAFCADPVFTTLTFYLMARVGADRELARRLGPGFAKRRARNRVIIERAVARGELPAGVDADAILNAMMGLGMTWNAGSGIPSEADARPAVEQIIALARDPRPGQGAAAAKADPAHHRLYLFEWPPGAPAGRISEVEHLGGLTDPEAILAADERRAGRYAELWRDDHLVHIFHAG